MNEHIESVQQKNEKVRIKVTDQCNMHCWFCHSEGAPNSNDLIIDNNLNHVLRIIKEVFHKAHITGGEPFMYKSLESLIDMLEENGYTVLITSNGNFKKNRRNIDIVKRLEAINISFHSLNPEYYNSLTKSDRGEIIVETIKDNIAWLKNVLPVRINTVVSGDGKNQSLDDMIRFASEIGCELKLVPELRTKTVSMNAINELLARNGFSIFQKLQIENSSNFRDRYKDLKGNTIEVKKLVPYYPDCVCKNCSEIENCEEGFSFFRLGGNPLYCQACIKKPPIYFEEYMSLQWDNLKREYHNI